MFGRLVGKTVLKFTLFRLYWGQWWRSGWLNWGHRGRCLWWRRLRWWCVHRRWWCISWYLWWRRLRWWRLHRWRWCINWDLSRRLCWLFDIGDLYQITKSIFFFFFSITKKKKRNQQVAKLSIELLLLRKIFS